MWLIENFINPGPTKLTLLAILLREGINTEHQSTIQQLIIISLLRQLI